MINCDNHGEQTEHTIGDKHYCPECIQSIFDTRINNYKETSE